MKRKLTTLLFTIICVFCYGQDPVLTYENYSLYFIPGSMTKDGEALLVCPKGSVSASNIKGFIIYDGDFNVVRDFNEPTTGIPYQVRYVTSACLYDVTTTPVSQVSGDWTVVEDQTKDIKTDTPVLHFQVYSDDNTNHSRSICVSQTLFDNDEDFEYVRKIQTIVPVSMNFWDYVKEHDGTNSRSHQFVSTGIAALDSLLSESDVSKYEKVWDEDRGKWLYKIYKMVQYGGVMNKKGVEIVALDGTVKATLPNITYINDVFYFRGKCYVQGGNVGNYVLYLLTSNLTEVKEVMREKVTLNLHREGSNLIVDYYGADECTVVLSNMSGQVLRNVKATKGSTLISLHGLTSGVYNVSLLENSSPTSSAKVIIK